MSQEMIIRYLLSILHALETSQTALLVEALTSLSALCDDDSMDFRLVVRDLEEMAAHSAMLHGGS